MAVWFEAWSLPHLGAMTKVAGPIAAVEGSYQRAINSIGSGRIALKADNPEIASICDPPNNVETIIRVYESGEVVYSFFARTITRSYDPEQYVEISGPGIEAALDQVILYPFDWAGSDFTAPSQSTGLSLFIDTIYGGDNILANPGFESSKSNETQSIAHDYRHTTDLNGAITDTATTIVVTDGSGFPASNFRIVIGSEWIDVGTRTGNTLSGCTRGQYGTTATGHADAEQVDGGGKFTLTFNGQTTGNLDWNATPAEIEAALILLTNIVDVDVSGSGTAADKWLIEFVDPGHQDLPLMTYTNVSLTSGTFFTIDTYWGGGKGVADPWTKSYNPNSGIEHGGYDVFSPGSVALFGDPAHSGDSALGIDPNGSGPDPYPGAQQIVPVEPAGIYQARAWFYPVGSSVECALVIRDLNENLIAKVTQVCPADTWTQLTIDNVVPDINDEQVIFRVATLSNTTVNFWVDDMEFNEGLTAQPAGQIIQNLWTTATAQSRSVMTWLKHDSFSGSTDSDGVAWDENLSVVFPAGMTWLQVMDDVASFGYEWSIDWNSVAGQYELKVWNANGMGVDRSASNAPGIRASRVFHADAILAEPSANTILGRGGSNLVDERQDATLAAAYGRREGFLQDQDAVSLTTLGLALDKRLSDNDLDRTALKAQVDIAIGPGLDAQLGDVLSTYLPPLINVATASRVVALTVLVDSDGVVTRLIDLDRQRFRERKGGTTSTATSQALNRLLRKFDRISRAVAANASVANLVPTAATGGSGKNVWTMPGWLMVLTGGDKLPFEYSADLNRVIIRLAEAPTGSAVSVDVIKNLSSSVFASPIVVSAGSTYALAVPDFPSLVPGDFLTVDVQAVGSTFPGRGMTVTVDWTGTGGA